MEGSSLVGPFWGWGSPAYNEDGLILVMRCRSSFIWRLEDLVDNGAILGLVIAVSSTSDAKTLEFQYPRLMHMY